MWFFVLFSLSSSSSSVFSVLAHRICVYDLYSHSNRYAQLPCSEQVKHCSHDFCVGLVLKKGENVMLRLSVQ